MPANLAPADSSADRLQTVGVMNIEIRLFAAAAELTNTRQLRMQVAPGHSLREIRRRLTELYPVLQGLANVSRWAVDEHFVSDEFILNDDSTVAMIPPVSGG